jgi:hypothetical protein
VQRFPEVVDASIVVVEAEASIKLGIPWSCGKSLVEVTKLKILEELRPHSFLRSTRRNSFGAEDQQVVLLSYQNLLQRIRCQEQWNGCQFKTPDQPYACSFDLGDRICKFSCLDMAGGGFKSQACTYHRYV